VLFRSPFSQLQLWGWKTEGDPKSGAAPFKVEGEFWSYRASLPRDAKGQLPATLEVQRNFEQAVVAAKGTLLNVGNGRVVYRVKKGDDVFVGESGCGGGRGLGGDCTGTVHRLIRLAPMEQSVVVTADQIARSIADEGKAVFYGLYFDTDKAELKPASKPTLEQIAAWLSANPKNDVFIIGHTDMQGPVPHNLSLSKARAAAVVDALVKEYGVKKERLTPEGVASYAPLSNNTSEAGRAKNRRVEMVLR
jgi:outer membrane protein OmpA-like peptidoglycan-associated protein